mmetsp:Transcript_1788/g.2527  ORF Transcript_1788/g.2527 Transcript_1788/m.2527 type:complete len:416 (-) Transcript_1788:56-1303(-)
MFNVVTKHIRQFSRKSYSTTSDRVVIVGAKRTPIGSFGSSLSGLKASELGAAAIKGALESNSIDASKVDEVLMGNVLSAGMGQAPAKQASLFAGLSNNVPCTTVNKVCASGMKSVMFGAQAIATGQAGCVVAGGMESMSNVPYYLPKARTGYGYGHGQLLDGVLHDGLWDVYDDHHMGNAGEDCARKFSFSREQQDEFAIESYRRSAAAHDAGYFQHEIVPVSIKQRRGDPIIVQSDEEFSRIKFDKIPSLRPAFDKNGTITAANASTLNDGASALILMSESRAKQLGVKPLAVIRGFADAAQAPIEFTTAPAKALPIAFERAGVTKQDIDYFETNEAFSVVVMANNKLLGMEPISDKVNVFGGAVSLGHPIGNSGCRILVTLLNVLKQKDATLGAASICNGGGGASALIVERLS